MDSSNSSNVAAAVRGLADGFQSFKSEQQRELARLRADLDFTTTKANRAGLSLSGGGGHETSPQTKAAFERFLKTGDAVELKAINLATPADGGFALPKEIFSELLKVEKTLSLFRQVARVVQARSADFNLVIATNSVGAAWSSEAGSRTETSTPTFANIAPSFGEIYAAPRLSNWALDDLPSIGDWLVQEVGEQFAVAQDAAFLTGDGSSKPKGLLTYTTAATGDASRAFGTVEHVASGVSGAWPASNPIDVLLGTVHKLKAAYRANASWMMSASTLDTVRKFKDGQGLPIWSPSLAAGQPSTLLGFPVYEHEGMPAIAANSLSVAFGDFAKGYVIADRTETSLIVDPFSVKGMTTYYCARRVGGALLDSNGIKLIKFSAT